MEINKYPFHEDKNINVSLPSAGLLIKISIGNRTSSNTFDLQNRFYHLDLNATSTITVARNYPMYENA